ncbi:MAG: O-antigen ligase family protein [Cyanobacteria bacterium P01_E01_bin.42]
MKELLLDPLILPLILGMGILYLAIAFNYLGTHLKYTILYEKACLILFLVTISGATGATIEPLTKLHPRVLSNTTVTPPTIVAQIGLYGIALLLLTPLLRYTLKDFISIFGILITRNPFLYLFLLLIFLSASWSNDFVLTVRTSFVILETAVFAIYAGKRFTWQELYTLLLWFHTILVFLAFFYGFGKPSVGVSDGAWVGINGHKNQFCFLMALSAVFWFIQFLYQPKQRPLCAFIILMSLFALNEGGSGAGKVTVVCLCGLWFYLGFVKTLPVQWAVTSVILFMILSIMLTILVTENLEFIVVDTLNKDMTLTGRTDFWPLIIDKINERPILGYGIDGFWQPWQGANNPAAEIIVQKTQFSPPHSHNGFMDLAVDLGYLGLFLFIASFIASIVKAVIYLTRTPMPYAGLPILLLTYILLTNLTETGLLGVTSIFFWYIAVTTRTSIDISNV